ncbi:VOC family protein [Paenibacillus sp. SYP-B3998]|uniref:VOC family protein n=2 Tax=Paenibacillus sp. SYP-B3998 TaxID=2678564 RepID=A0A6G3ZS11_9BACL|nr:VOC family protein [Paenibacillus sp. SYP-B3998]
MSDLSPQNNKRTFASMKGHHVAVRVPDYEASKRWFVEKLDFRVVQEWPYGDMNLAYLAPANDNTFFIEILGGGTPSNAPIPSTVNDSLHEAGYHHFCLHVDRMDDMIAELRRRGVTIIGEPFELEAINRRLAFIADQWGNLIELAQLLENEI